MQPVFRSQLSLMMLSFLIVGLSPQTGQSEETLYRWKVRKGDRFHVTMSQETTQTMKAGKSTTTVPAETLSEMTWVVQSVDENGMIHMGQTIDRMKITQTIPGQSEVVFDSASTEEPTGIAKSMAATLKPLLGQTMTQVMDDRGQIHDVKIPKEALAGLNETQAGQVTQSEEMITNMMRQASPVLPQEPVSAGFSWENNTVSKTTIGEMGMDITYTYNGQQPDDAGKQVGVFDVEMKMSLDESSSFNGAKLKVLNQDNKGEMFFDAQQGQLSRSVMNQDMTMEVNAGPVQMLQNVKSKTTVNVKRE